MKECPTCKLCYVDREDYCPTDGSHLMFVFAGNVVLEERYQLEQCIGRGGMGVVYKGRHLLLKTQHAIKVILPELVGGDPGLVRRFRQEAMVAASIRHQNIVQVTDFGVVGEKMPFIVMDYIKGELLHDVLEREGKLPPARVIEIITAIGAGVGLAHQQGIIHRDLKPLNVMIQEGVPLSEGIKVLDFGLAKIKSGDILGSFVLAQTSGLMGSPYYMAPEQWSEEEPDARADIYSMGIMLYQMLAGEVPFRGPSVPVIMKKHMFDSPPTFQSLGTDVAPPIDAVVRSCLEKNPEKRPRSVEELIRTLRQAIDYSSAQLQMPEARLRAQLDSAPTAPAVKSRRASRAKSVKEKASRSDPLVRAEIERDEARIRAEQDAREQARLLQEERARLEAEAIRRAEHERLLQEERARAEEEARRRAALELRLAEEREKAEEQRRKHDELAKKLKEQQERAAAERAAMYRPKDAPAFPPSTLARLDETAPPPALAPQTLPQMSMHPSAFVPAPEVRPEPPPAPPQPPRPTLKDTLPLSSPSLMVPSPPTASRLPLLTGIVGAAVVLVALAGLGLYFMWPNSKTSDGKPSVASLKNDNMVKISGGSFVMGRDNVPSYFLNESPGHQVTVGAISMDKTEVTSAEYSECVKAGTCRRPPGWSSDSPPSGQEKWPVTSVSVDDANAFASWRSKRDGVNYRLPTEGEWEYAARSGNNDYLYPWGGKWIDGSANVGTGTKSPAPVGSYPQGASSQGVQDLIGNVWEWTSSKASIYPGNGKAQLGSGEENYFVFRGGCFASATTGDDAATATRRKWAEPSFRSEYIGFRLVKAN